VNQDDKLHKIFTQIELLEWIQISRRKFSIIKSL